MSGVTQKQSTHQSIGIIMTSNQSCKVALGSAFVQRFGSWERRTPEGSYSALNVFPGESMALVQLSLLGAAAKVRQRAARGVALQMGWRVAGAALMIAIALMIFGQLAGCGGGSDAPYEEAAPVATCPEAPDFVGPPEPVSLRGCKK